MDNLNIGLIGYGYIGQVHTIAYKSLPILTPFFEDKYNMSLVVSRKLENTKAPLYPIQKKEEVFLNFLVLRRK